MAINQLTTANSFNEWLDATSSLIAVANSLTSNAGGGLIANSSIFIQGAAASLNVRTLANINTLRANTAYIANTYFNESNVTIQLDLTVGRNVSTISLYGNEIYQKGVNVSALAQRIEPAFVHANSGFNHANSGFIQANAAFNHTNSGFIQANSSYTHVNAAFNHANSGFIQANAAFNHANSGFIQANSSYTHVNAAFNHANSGFIQANAGITHAQSAFNHANSGFIQANAAFDHANSGFIQANSSYSHVNAAFNHANSSFIRANNSLNANIGGIITGNVIIRSSGGLRSEIAEFQDAVIIKGRDGGTSSYSATIVPAELTNNITVTIPSETFTIGFRNIPAVGEKTTAYTLAIDDIGKFVKVGAGGSIEIPDAVFSEGDAVTIFNNTSEDVVITCSITTAYVSAYNSEVSSIILSTRGISTIMFLSSTSCVVLGNVLGI